MTITPITHSNSNMSLFILHLFIFIVVLYLCINPGKIVVSNWIFINSFIINCNFGHDFIKGFVDYKGHSSSHGNPEIYSSNIESFSLGFIEGYLSMDAIAAIVHFQ